MTNPHDTEETSQRAAVAVAQCQTIFAHAWMVRTFVKHSDEMEDFPELMQIVRAVFDTCRALESKVPDPQAYLTTLKKKFSKLRAAVVQFRVDAPVASDHENFRQAVLSLNGCLAELEAILKQFPAQAPPAMPANFRLPVNSVTLSTPDDSPDDSPAPADEFFPE